MKRRKLISWNVNGIRSVARKGFYQWLETAQPDVLSVQETRAWPEQLTDELLRPHGYESYFSRAEKKGYSGVAIYTRERPLNVIEGIDNPTFDCEGRTVTANSKISRSSMPTSPTASATTPACRTSSTTVLIS